MVSEDTKTAVIFQKNGPPLNYAIWKGDNKKIKCPGALYRRMEKASIKIYVNSI